MGKWDIVHHNKHTVQYKDPGDDAEAWSNYHSTWTKAWLSKRFPVKEDSDIFYTIYPGGGYLGYSLMGMCRWPLTVPIPSVVYFVSNYRPHLSHFLENVSFAIPTWPRVILNVSAIIAKSLPLSNLGELSCRWIPNNYFQVQIEKRKLVIICLNILHKTWN